MARSPSILPRSDDLRAQRTRRKLTQALVELTAERPIDTVTVRDLTAQAGIGYATFFRHYVSMADLLQATVDDLYAELLVLFPPLTGHQPEEAGAVVFRHVQEHPGLYRLLLNPDRSLGLTDRIMEIGMKGLLTVYEPRPDARVPPDLAAYQFVRSFLSLIEWWLDQEEPPSPERMGQIYQDLVLRPTELVALQLV